MRTIVFYCFAILIIVSPKTAVRMARKILPAEESSTLFTRELPYQRKPKYILMVRDALSLVEEVWCSFDSLEELTAAQDGLNQVYDGLKSFWGKDDEPPKASSSPNGH